MLVYGHPTKNRFNNVDYLLACPETGEAVAIDPWDAGELLAIAKEAGWAIRCILNTHTHADHTRGNEALREATGAPVFVHPAADNRTQGSKALDLSARLRVGHCELQVLDTPGHTQGHVCLLSESEQPFLISGDTLFHAGAGNCHNGGDPEQLFETFKTILWPMAHHTILLPGHDYKARNLQFATDREPGNPTIESLLDKAQKESGAGEFTTLGQEHACNPFFRLKNPVVIDALRAAFPNRDFGSIKARFLAMRELRNRW